MGQAQNQAVKRTSTRCWVSRRYTLMADKKIARAIDQQMSATNASGRRGRYDQSGWQRRATIKMTSTMAWKKKNTLADPMDAKAKISRGNEIFFTKPALLTTTPVAVTTASWNMFQTKNPENKKITKFGMPFFEIDWNTTK